MISGYLISGILFADLARGSFSIYEFYVRRVKRIFPALAVVLITAMAIGWTTLISDEFVRLGKDVIGCVLFIANFMFWSQAGYFDAAAETKPLLHIWSLGVEEQFYLIWPALLYLSARFRCVVLMILTVGVGSFTLNLLTYKSSPAAAVFLPHTRFWELMLGGILAYAHSCRIVQAQTKLWCSFLVNSASIAGLALIIISVVVLKGSDPFPGWLAVFPTIGAALLIASGEFALVNRLFLGNRLFVFIGLVSYPLYLWHWPLLSYGRIARSAPLDATTIFCILAASFVLACGTYWLIELPVRHSPSKVRYSLSAGLCYGLLLVGVVAAPIAMGFLRPSSGATFDEIAAAAHDWDYPGSRLRTVKLSPSILSSCPLMCVCVTFWIAGVPAIRCCFSETATWNRTIRE